MSFIKPLREYVLLETINEDSVTKSGIILAEKHKEVPTYGKVVAFGPGQKMKDGSYDTMALEVGQTVMHTKYVGIEMKDNGIDYVLLKYSDILAVKS